MPAIWSAFIGGRLWFPLSVGVTFAIGCLVFYRVLSPAQRDALERRLLGRREEE